MDDKAEARLRRKLAKRDARIAGLQRRCLSLEVALASRALDVATLTRDVERAVQRALCNVRMIPVLGVSGSDRIVEITATESKRAGK